MKLQWYVYIIECFDGSYYVGRTLDPVYRWIEHLLGIGSKYTRIHKPKEMVYIEECESYEHARQREKQLKCWTRAKKERLIKGNWGPWQ